MFCNANGRGVGTWNITGVAKQTDKPWWRLDLLGSDAVNMKQRVKYATEVKYGNKL